MGDDVLNKFGRMPWDGGMRGPMPGEGRGPGRPWGGIVEDTPVIWITWLVALAKKGGRPVEGLRVEVAGTVLTVTHVELTFGRRYYFRCPECWRRCEAIYFLGQRVACRKCLSLGYRSQTHRPGSPWATADYVFSRRPWFPRRWEIPPQVGEAFAELVRLKAQRAAEEIIERVKVWEADR